MTALLRVFVVALVLLVARLVAGVIDAAESGRD